MLGILKRGRNKEWENIIGLMETDMKGNGIMINQTVKETISKTIHLSKAAHGIMDNS